MDQHSLINIIILYLLYKLNEKYSKIKLKKSLLRINHQLILYIIKI